jgi:two-component system LytT family sensor kinase
MAIEPAVTPLDLATHAGVAKVDRWFPMSWGLYVLFGLLLGLYFSLNEAIDNPHRPVWMPLTWNLSSVLFLWPMIPLIVLYERAFPVDSRPRWRLLPIHLFGAVIFSAVHVAGIIVARKLVYAFAGENYVFGSVAVRGFYEFQKDLVIYSITLVVTFAYREFQTRRRGELRATQLSAELSDARLKHLTAQIEPHFLFNTLNAISNRMHEDVNAADRMISDLGALLRAAYDSDSHVMVPLARELEWLRGYAAMMTERYRGQLHFELRVSAGLEHCQVPRLLLQPLVENALRHGLPDGRGHLRVEVERRDSTLSYLICDDGVGVDASQLLQGTGLSNIARRLELLYPGKHTFTLAPRAPKGTQVTVIFPVSS